MAILDLQRSVRTVGRIRIGQQVTTRSGKLAPAKLSTFRLSSPQRAPIDRAASLYGGTVAEMTSDRSDDQWEVVTDVSSLPVVIPPVNHLSQHYELWDAAGCQRRCDGREASVIDGRPVRGTACECDPDRRDCTITTRLSVVLPELEALGVWRLDTKGWYAASELAGAADLCAASTARGAAIPARLDLEQRTRRSRDRDGKPQTFKFAVPVLSVDVSLPQARAILGGLDANTGEITQPVPVAIQPPQPMELARSLSTTDGTSPYEAARRRKAEEQPAEPRQALPPPPAATIPAPRTHEQYEQANAESKPPVHAAAAQAQREGRLSTPTRQGTIRPDSTYEMNVGEAPAFIEPEQQATSQPSKPAENSKGANWHRSVAPLVPDETDRRALIWLASKGRTNSANDAKPAERTKAHDWARAINDKQAELDLSEAGGVRMVALIGPDGGDIERHEQPAEEAS